MARIRSRRPPPATAPSKAVSETRLRIQLWRAGPRDGVVSAVRAGSRLEVGAGRLVVGAGRLDVGAGRLVVGAGVGGGIGSETAGAIGATVAAGAGSGLGVPDGSHRPAGS